jgi:hypothetical protein
VSDLPVKFEWKTCVGFIQEDVKTFDLLPPGQYTVLIDHINGDYLAPKYQHMTTLKIFDSYVMIGGHNLCNGRLTGEDEVVVSEPSFLKRVVIHNYPHNFRKRQ